MMQRAPALLAAATLLAACCGPRVREDLIVVLPGSDGHVGAITVEAAGSKMLLDKAYAGAKPGAQGMAPVEVSKDEVDSVFAGALGARPIPPKSYTLYFLSGGTELDPASKAQMDAMLKEVGERKAAEIVITGHTDTVGPAADNDRLSRERAVAVASALAETFAARGVKSDAVTTAGRGEREPLLKTPDQTPEPKNRRVEITVR
jgi:outer membrane protein OmpA-like peptidoglycan-associated protein